MWGRSSVAQRRGLDTLGDRLLNRPDGPQPGDDVTDTTLLEEIARQAQEMANQIASDLEAQTDSIPSNGIDVKRYWKVDTEPLKV